MHSLQTTHSDELVFACPFGLKNRERYEQTFIGSMAGAELRDDITNIRPSSYLKNRETLLRPASPVNIGSSHFVRSGRMPANGLNPQVHPLIPRSLPVESREGR